MSLSERIRENSEAAPWVCEEVKRLESRLAEWEQAAEFYRMCKADPKSHEVGAMRDAVEWLLKIASQPVSNQR